MILDFSVKTDIGKRKLNEDYALCVRRKDGISMFIVCDGLGGHTKGDAASKFVTEYFKDEFLKKKTIDSDFLEHCFYKAQKALNNEKKKLKSDMSTMLTTASVLIADDKCFQTAHCGDSRIYTFCDGKAVFRTSDHSIPQLLFEQGEIKESEIRKHPDRNKIICAVGVTDDDFRVTISPIREYNERNDFLLCTDGLWEYVTEKQMEKCLSGKKSAKDWIKALFKEVDKNGKNSNLDNYTAIAIKCTI